MTSKNGTFFNRRRSKDLRLIKKMAAMALATYPVDPFQQTRRLTLQKNTVAFEFCGPLIELPSGMELEFIGEGLVESMVKVRANETSYFIFLRDLDDFIDDAASLYS